MSIATGRDPQAGNLLANKPSSVQIAIPGICCLEALSALEQNEKSRTSLEQQLNIQINEADRDRTSSHAQALRLYLDQSRAENRMLIEETKKRMFAALRQSAIEADIIALNAEIIQSSLNQILIADLTDNLILHCILVHARNHPTEIKVFMSGNVNDFGRSGVREALDQAGVSNYFSRTQDFLGWLQSQT